MNWLLSLNIILTMMLIHTYFPILCSLEAILDSYYGTDNAAATKAVDLDSATYNVEQHAAEILRAHSLPDLIAYRMTIDREGRALQEEMEALVTTEYRKFITATDTIRKMKGSVIEMDKAMERLTKETNAMGGSSALVNQNLQENRGKIEQLVGVQNLLTQLEYLFELPTRLKREIELDSLTQAVHSYIRVRDVLTKYDHQPSIHSIRVEADKIMQGLKARLRDTIKASFRAVEQGTLSSMHILRTEEAFQLLVKLREPRKALRTTFLSFERIRLLHALNRYARETLGENGHKGATSDQEAAQGASHALLSENARLFASLAHTLHPGSGGTGADAAVSLTPQTRPRLPITHVRLISEVNKIFVDAFKSTAELYKTLFEGLPSRSFSESESFLSPIAEEEKLEAEAEFDTFTRDLFQEYFDFVRRNLSLSPSLSTSKPSGDKASSVPHSSRSPLTAELRNNSIAAVTGVLDDDEADAALTRAATLAAAQKLMEGHSDSPAGRYESLLDSLRMLYSDISGLSRFLGVGRSAKYQSSEGPMWLIDRAQEAVERILRAQIVGLFGDVRGYVVQKLIELQVRVDQIYESERLKYNKEYSRRRRARRRALLAPGGTDAEGAKTTGGGGSEGAESASASDGEGDASEAFDSNAEDAEGEGNATETPLEDWLLVVGRTVALEAEALSTSITARLILSIDETAPLVAAAVRLLPELAKTFVATVQAQMLDLVVWIAGAMEATGDPIHPSRAEWKDKVVEADLGLDNVDPTRTKESTVVTGINASASIVTNRGKRKAIVSFSNPEVQETLDVDTKKSENVHMNNCILPFLPDKHFTFLLLLASACRHFANNGVVSSLSTMINAFPNTSKFGDDRETDESMNSMVEVPNIIKSLLASGRELLRRYVYHQGARLSVLLRQALNTPDWLHYPEPTHVRSIVSLIVSDLHAIKKLASAALTGWDENLTKDILARINFTMGVNPISGDATASGSSAAGTVATTTPVSSNPYEGLPALRGTGAGNTPKNVAQATFAKRVGAAVGAVGCHSSGLGIAGSLFKIGPTAAAGSSGASTSGASAEEYSPSQRFFGRTGLAAYAGGSLAPKFVLGVVDYTAESIVAALYQVCVHNFTEWIRNRIFSPHGFHQIQVDLAALFLASPYFLLDSTPSTDSSEAMLHYPLSSHHLPYGGSSGFEDGSGMTNSMAVTASNALFVKSEPIEESVFEASSSAADRCLSPEPIEPSVLFSVISEWWAKYHVALAN